MSKRNIEAYIPKVMEILNQKFDKGIMPKEFNGYISSFGASTIQSGLLPTLALFENKDSSTAQEKSCLSKIILEVLQYEDEIKEYDSLLNYVLNNDVEKLKVKIIDISIAIKLSIRTFKLEKDLKDVKC